MAHPPVPQRIPPLRWRNPAILWTPIALAIAIGWPAALFFNDAGMQRLTVIVGATVFAFALVTLGFSWLVGQGPRARRTVVLHVLFAGLLASLGSPFLLTKLLAIVADYEHAGAAANFSPSMAMAMAPLSLVIGLPVALISGIAFAWVALKRLPPDDAQEPIIDRDVQPFR